MKRYRLPAFGVESLLFEEAPTPEPGPGEVRVAWHALSLNYRDVLVVSGRYNPRLALPVTPLSDGAGVVAAVGPDVAGLAVGDRVVSHFVADWQDGPFRGEYLASTLGTPGPGVAAQESVLPARALLRMPERMDFVAASTLPIAALTAWSALVEDGGVGPGRTVLTLGTGGVSLFAVQLAHAMGSRVIVTSKSPAKLERARALGADECIDYAVNPDWDKQVRKLGGADLVVENGGAGTLSRSLRSTLPGGRVALLGALTGLEAVVDVAPLVMKRLRVHGVMVDSRRAFEDLLRFVAEHAIEPVVDHVGRLADLPAELAAMERGEHFGKIVLRTGAQ